MHRGEVVCFVWVLSQVVALHRGRLQREVRKVSTIKRANADDSCPLHTVCRGIRLMVTRQIQITIQFRDGWDSSSVTSWRTGGQIVVQVAEHWSVVVVHRATPRNVEFVSRERPGRQRRGKFVSAAASRAGDAPTERAVKRVRFAADRVEDDAETPEATWASAPSSLFVKVAMTISYPAHSSEPALPASAVEVLDQVMRMSM